MGRPDLNRNELSFLRNNFVDAGTLGNACLDVAVAERFDHCLAKIINHVPAGIILFSGNGKIELANFAMGQILGKQPKDIVGTPLFDLFVGHNPLIGKSFYKDSFNNVEVFLNGIAQKIPCLVSGYINRAENGAIDSGIIFFQIMDRLHRPVVRSGARAQYCFDDIIGASKVLQKCIANARIAASNDSNVLLQGESGTGKEVFAQAVHNASSRAQEPFVAINCGAIPRELVGSELFGYVEGAFTGAKRGGKIGKFELACGGTIFLDEIGDMPFDLQVALLRVLQNRRIIRIGDSREISIDVRVICATNKDLRCEIEKGNFREDLYYRLNVISITIPPLRDRKEDIPLLVKYMLGKWNGNHANILSILEPGIMDCLQNYSWPGNVRELQNIIERLVSISLHRSISCEDLPPEIIFPLNTPTIMTHHHLPLTDSKFGYKQKRKQDMAAAEYHKIVSLLSVHRGNVSQVAREMGLSRMTLYRKMKLYSITRDHEDQ